MLLLYFSLLLIPLFILYTFASWYISVKKRSAEIRKLNSDKDIAIFEYYFPTQIMNIIPLADILPIPKAFTPLERRWNLKGYFVYKTAKSDIIAIVNPYETSFHVADADIVKEIVTRKADFVKPIRIYTILQFFGENVVTSEGIDYKRHRKIVAPRFGEKNNLLVFDQTKANVQAMFDNWKNAYSTETDGYLVDTNNEMMKLALHVISSAAFGSKLDWEGDDKEVLKKNHKLSFKTTVEEVIEGLRLKILLPSIAYQLPFKSIQRLKLVFDEFESYLTELIDAASDSNEANLLTSLVNASREETDGSGLSMSELLGNIFIFMFAGHETTAATLTRALGLLALDPSKQHRLFEEIHQVTKGKDFTYKQLGEFCYTNAVMNETLRMFGPVITIPKQCCGVQSAGKYTFSEDSRIDLHACAVHYNPKYWGPDPEAFRPERWFKLSECAASASKTAEMLKISESGSANEGSHEFQMLTYNRYAFIPFSEGVRSCLGKRFAQVEVITALVLIVQNFTIHPSFGMKDTDVTESKNELTLQSKKHIKLVFKPRFVRNSNDSVLQ